MLSGLSSTNFLGAGLAFIKFEPSLGIAATRINKLGMDIRSFREPLTRAIKQVMMPSIRTNFDVSGRPAWEPLSEATWDMRAKMGYTGGDILLLTGNLRQVSSQFNIWTITTTSATIRDLPQKIWYGKVHQAGYEGQSMKKRIAAHGGDAGAAMRSLFKDLNIIHNSLAAAGTKPGRSTKGGPGGSRITQSLSEKTGLRVTESPAIPQREFLLIQPEDEADIQDIFMEWLGERVVAAWPV